MVRLELSENRGGITAKVGSRPGDDLAEIMVPNRIDWDQCIGRSAMNHLGGGEIERRLRGACQRGA